MKEKQFYNQIRNMLDNLPENFSILEEQIDVDIQMRYFDYAQKIRKEQLALDCFDKREELFHPEIQEDRKREILVSIAAIDDIKAFRTIEKFVNESQGELKLWAILALQESRMLIQSSLLDEQQVFISTGLGGRGQKLRYYVVFINREKEEPLNKTQQKLLKDELVTELKSHDGEFESIDFNDGFSTALVMLPLQTDLKNIFRNIIDECNQYGGFLDEDMILTNVKMLSRNEIGEMLKNGKLSDLEITDDFDEFEDYSNDEDDED